MELPKPEKVKGRCYAIDFDTKKSAGYITALKVTLSEDVVDMDETVRVDLADDPLYYKLQRYVLANPR